MATTIGGNDPNHDLTEQEKEGLERSLRAKAREMIRQGKAKERKKMIDRAQDISRQKSKMADHH